MSTAIKENVLKALGGVRDPERGGDIVALGMVQGLQVTVDGRVLFSLAVDPARGAALEPLRQAAEQAASAVSGVKEARAVLTAEKPAAPDPHGMSRNPPLVLPVRKIIAVASGKGGVGKSTVAFNLAVALAQAGLKTGLLDADIYGPSVPRLSGLKNMKPQLTPHLDPPPSGRGEGREGGRLIPLEAHGVKLMSMGFLVEEEKPMIWRGPMVQTALYQMMRDVEWGSAENPLDILVIDMPPGTGDAQLTMAQKVPLAGAVIVSTPQDLALIDARKAIEMFRKTNVPVLGIVENMSTYICSNCGHEEHIFGHGGARAEAEKLGVPFLGEIPLRADIREKSDAGIPVGGDYFRSIVTKLNSG